jgi:hypothetical protein
MITPVYDDSGRLKLFMGIQHELKDGPEAAGLA